MNPQWGVVLVECHMPIEEEEEEEEDLLLDVRVGLSSLIPAFCAWWLAKWDEYLALLPLSGACMLYLYCVSIHTVYGAPP